MQPLIVPQIDFLPASYRQKGAARRDRRWRFVAMGLGFALLAAGWTYRTIDRHSTQRELDALAERYTTAAATNEQWANVQRRRAETDTAARLVTYLKHPWPTSRMLSAVVTPLPESIRLTELKIVQEADADRRGAAAPPRVSLDGKPDAAEKALPPATRDLQRLQSDNDFQRTIVHLSGETSDGDALHAYLRRLSSDRIILRAELVSFQSATPGATASGVTRTAQFQARVLLRPGFGQPGGPDSTANSIRVANREGIGAVSP